MADRETSTIRRDEAATSGRPPSAVVDPLDKIRDFGVTPEPRGAGVEVSSTCRFVVQKHAASHLHYDFRLEVDGTLRSWAVPKGPSLDPSIKRMAVQVEDHPLAYADFEGTIPAGQYGAGSVIVWDRGSWTPEGDPSAALGAGRLEFRLDGVKLGGRWALIRLRPRPGERQTSWLLIKLRDEAARDSADFDVLQAEPDSVLTPPRGRTADDAEHPVAPAAAAEAEAASPDITAAAVRPPHRRKRATAAEVPPGASGVTHADRVVDATSGITKGDLADYYERFAALMLPHLKARPVALVRAPAGVAGPKFFQKHADAHADLPGIVRLDRRLDPEHEPLLEIVAADGLQSAAQLNVVELHTWNMVTATMPSADRMVFDLDPGEGVDPAALRAGVETLKALLDEIGLQSFLKTSGGKGLHVVVPLAARHDWQLVRQFSEAVVVRLAGMVPQRFVAKSGPKNRVGRIFVDYLRNGWGATTACAWSARARAGLGVSVPVDWNELPQIDAGDRWTVRNVTERLALGNRPWDGAAAARRQTLTRAMKALDFRAPLT